eukprot:g1906.t1
MSGMVEEIRRCSSRDFMRPGVLLTEPTLENLTLMKQVGAEDIVLTCPPEESSKEDIYSYLESATKLCRKVGLRVAVLERFLPNDKIIHGKAGAGKQMKYVEHLIECMGRLHIPTLCYNWMPQSDWTRTSSVVRERGGALVTAFDSLERKTVHLQGNKERDEGITSAEKLWSTLKGFLAHILPVCEKNNVVLAIHPDDPPVAKLGSHPQIIFSAERLAKVVDLVKSPANGVCFCQGTLASAGEDIPKAIRRLGKAIKFVHFRDVVCTTPGVKFRESWQDNGDTDQASAMRAYRDIGFSGTIRPDHVPTCEGEDNKNPGYHILGRLWALGYIRGLIQAVGSEKRVVGLSE